MPYLTQGRKHTVVTLRSNGATDGATVRDSVHVEVKSKRRRNDDRKFLVNGRVSAGRDQSETDGDARSVSIHRQYLTAEAVHHHALRGLYADPWKRSQVLLRGLVVVVNELGEGDFTEILRQPSRDQFETVCSLSRQACVGDQ